MVSIKKSVDIQFKNILYNLQVVAEQDLLFIKLRNTTTDEEFTGKYNQDYIQEMTRKTGNYKKFSVFLEMLLSTIENESGPVNLDLLQGKELKNIQGKTVGDKVYLVVTYAVAFDRVHYPIPLVKENSSRNKENSSRNSENNLAKEEFREKEKELNIRMARLLKENQRLREEMLDLRENVRDSRDFSKFKRQMDSEIRLLERNGGGHVVLSSVTRLKGLLKDLYSGLGISSTSRSVSMDFKSSPVKARPVQKEKYQVIKSRPLQTAKSTYNAWREPKNSYTSPYSKVRERSSSGSRERKPFKRFDPTEYIRSREQSLEKKRNANVYNNYSRCEFNTKKRSNSLTALNRKSSASLESSRENLPRSKSQKTSVRRKQEPMRKQEPISLEFLKENSSIDQRLEEIHRILKSTLA